MIIDVVAGGAPWPASCPLDTDVATPIGVTDWRTDGGGIAPFARVGVAGSPLDTDVATPIGVTDWRTDGAGIAPFARVGVAGRPADEARLISAADAFSLPSAIGWPQPLPPAIGLHAGVGSPGAQSVMGGEVVLSLWGL